MGKEALPNQGNTLASLRYVQNEASLGHFKGHSSALLVLYYLVTNMWVKAADDAGPGEVMHGKSSIGAIADGTALSRRTVQYALEWLAEEEWIDTQRTVDSTGREGHRYIYVRVDMPGHRERERRRSMSDAADRILAEAGLP